MNLEIPGLKTVCNIKWSLSIYHEAKYLEIGITV